MIPTKEMKAMRAFHGDASIKEKYLKRVKAHARNDEIIKGKYWEDGKGCAVGCTIEGSEHKRYETELGIPAAIAYVEDTFFELMPNKDAMTYPRRFLEAIPVGADLSLVPAQLIVYILDDVLTVKEVQEDVRVTDSVKTIINLWKDVLKGKVARSAAWSAARSAAWSAAESAAWSAARSAARSAAESAAESAAWSAARSAARSAAWSAARSAAWSAARSAAWSAAGKKYGDALLELLKQAPIDK